MCGKLKVKTNSQRHFYHLVESSPWPLLASFGSLFLTTGSVMYMHSVEGGKNLLFMGLSILFMVMVSWWGDVISEGVYRGFHTREVQSNLSLGVVLFIVSEVMFFFGFFWAFFHSSLVPTMEMGSIWPAESLVVMDAWSVPFLNTVILLLSGVFITKVHHFILEGSGFFLEDEGFRELELWSYLKVLWKKYTYAYVMLDFLKDQVLSMLSRRSTTNLKLWSMFWSRFFSKKFKKLYSLYYSFFVPMIYLWSHGQNWFFFSYSKFFYKEWSLDLFDLYPLSYANSQLFTFCVGWQMFSSGLSHDYKDKSMSDLSGHSSLPSKGLWGWFDNFTFGISWTSFFGQKAGHKIFWSDVLFGVLDETEEILDSYIKMNEEMLSDIDMVSLKYVKSNVTVLVLFDLLYFWASSPSVYHPMLAKLFVVGLYYWESDMLWSDYMMSYSVKFSFATCWLKRIHFSNYCFVDMVNKTVDELHNMLLKMFETVDGKIFLSIILASGLFANTQAILPVIEFLLGTEKSMEYMGIYELDSMSMAVFLAQLSCVGMGMELGKLAEDQLALLLEMSNSWTKKSGVCTYTSNYWIVLNRYMDYKGCEMYFSIMWNFFITLFLASFFVYFQYIEYGDACFGISDGMYGSTFYMATGFHGFHVIIGTTFLFICFVSFLRYHFEPKHHVGLEAAMWYWHFVDVVWLFLFVSIYWWGST